MLTVVDLLCFVVHSFGHGDTLVHAHVHAEEHDNDDEEGDGEHRVDVAHLGHIQFIFLQL